MLARDKANVLRFWLALGRKEDTLRRGFWDEEEAEWRMRDEPSDDVSEWLGVTVNQRVMRFALYGDVGEPLTGTIPVEIGRSMALPTCTLTTI